MADVVDIAIGSASRQGGWGAKAEEVGWAGTSR
eukprot:CAMPEP_0206607784 /NCGR_PEP_ID=MMETSP0325_2-20121206/52464_1 /ASSEMBLY_ACC=CAM_ASM_000347 /TAXON_ID=2866 /ORGANISM="Crypthecodinium cohnii, Strain Seligo" /LENGTH=32 /DNA_ID= /DNA_START= /DNA_END= /DNA_ORIENTATION=